VYKRQAYPVLLHSCIHIGHYYDILWVLDATTEIRQSIVAPFFYFVETQNDQMYDYINSSTITMNKRNCSMLAASETDDIVPSVVSPTEDVLTHPINVITRPIP